MNATQIAGPIVLFLLMSIVGLELTLDDFRRVARKPAAVLGGTVAQIVCLPLMTWVVVWLFDLNPVFGAGAVLVAVSPGAGISNVLVAVARGNVALSVSLTAFASVLAVVTMPTVASLGMQLFLEGAGDVEVPVVGLFLQLVFMLLTPITLGMTLRSSRPDLADRIGPPLRRVTMVVMAVAVTVGALLADAQQLDLAGSGAALLAAAVWTLSAMVIGWGTARALGLDAADRFTFLIEFSARNIAVSAIVALSGLGRMDLTFFSGVYMLVGYPLAVVATLWRRRATRGRAG